MRFARLHVPGVVHHLIWRFVEHRWFLDSNAARNRYRWFLGRALDESDWRCVSYALMSNHIHIAAVAGREPLAAWSRRANVPFAQWLNERRSRIGPVFADRASDYAIAPAKVANLIAYIHNNPVRANVVGTARDSGWTSHRAYLGGDARPRWLHVEEGLELANMTPEAFDAFAAGQPPEPDRPSRSRVALEARRRGPINIATPFDRQVPLVIRPFGRIVPDARRVLDLVCAGTGLAPTEVASRRRNPTLHIARVAVIHCGLAAGVTSADLAAVLGVSRQAISKNAHRAQRPQPLCDSVLDQLRREAWAG